MMDIFEASKKSNVKEMQRLIKKGIDVNSTSGSSEWTPLMYACERDHSPAVQLLLGSGADCEIQSSHGVTALMIACHHRHFEIVKLLLKHGVNLKVKSKRNWTVLHYALDTHSPKMSLLLHKHSHLLLEDDKIRLQKEKYCCSLSKEI